MRIPAPLRRLALATGRRLPPGAVRAINLARGIDAARPVDLPPGRRVAVVAPHPDDELVGVGGTIAKHVAAGHQIRIVMVTSGEASASFLGQDLDTARAQREDEAVAALEEVGIGADQVVFLRLAERDLSGGTHAGTAPVSGGTRAVAQHGQALSEVLASFGPDLVYCPSPADGHSVHAAVASLLAASLAGLSSVGHVALYEVMTPIYPTVVVDVTAHIEAKLAGLGHYASALASFDIVHAARGLAAYRSVHAQHGRGYAEAFTLLRPAELVDLARRVSQPDLD